MSDKYQKITVAGLMITQFKNEHDVHTEHGLAIRRSSKETFLSGHYELPGGKVDFGEDPRDALAREFREEVNIPVEVADAPYRVFTYTSDNGNRHTVELVYLVGPIQPDVLVQIKLSEEHDDYVWVDVNKHDVYVWAPDKLYTAPYAGTRELRDLQMTDEVKENIRVGTLKVMFGDY